LDTGQRRDGPAPAKSRSRSMWWWLLALLLPIVVSALSQLEPVQNAEGWFITGLPWDVGKRDIVADIVAPAWALSLIVLGALNRRLLDHFEPDPEFVPKSRLGRELGTPVWIRRTTWIVTGAAALLILLAFTREWERFGEQPRAPWYVGLLLVTLAICAVPLWWVRLDVERAIRVRIQSSPRVAAIDGYLFAGDGPHDSRWPQLAALAALTALAAWIALGQLNDLLRGMHLTNQPSFGVASLSNVFELDLSQKPAQVADVVATWVSFGTGLGPRFATGLDVLGMYLLMDTFLLIPAYVVVIGVLLLRARKGLPEELTGRRRRSYDLLIGAALSTLLIVVTADLMENLMMWMVGDGLWGGGPVANWSVRLMWAASLVRTVGFLLLGAAAVVLLALRRQRIIGVFQSLVAVRGELLVLLLLALAFTAMPQTADVVRRWTVSVGLITTLFATALAMLLQWTSHRALSGLWHAEARVGAGETLTPAVVQLPLANRIVPLRQLVVVALVAGFGLQLVATFVFDMPLGVRLGIPVLLITLLWIFGVPLPSAPFERGDRSVPAEIVRKLPRLLGASIFVVLGVTVIKSAVGQLIFARHGDWWLLFALVPLAVGVYRLQTQTGPRMGRLEAVILVAVGAVGIWLIVAADDPELSAAALTWAGVMLLYGAMPFYYSYEPTSAPSTVVSAHLHRVTVQPILAAGLVLAGLTAVGLILFPLSLAPAIGTIGIVVLAAMLFAAAAAALVGFAEWTRPPDILAAFRFRRTPVFVFLSLWLALAGATHNDIPIASGTSTGAESGITVDDVWERWLQQHPGIEAVPDDGSQRPAVPMVFVASSGGGLRASAWTGYVMDCVFGDGRASECPIPGAASSRSIVAMSGVSGGSIGLAAYAGSSVGAAGDEEDWVKARFGDDYLAAAIAWLAFVDTPRTFVGFVPRSTDRAALMERALERSWPSDQSDRFLANGIFEVWHNRPEIPVMIFNGTSVASPCRFNASVLDANAHASGEVCTSLLNFEGSTGVVDQSVTLAATQDLVDYLCPGQDVKLSTAALLSARFPIITPSGRVGAGLIECTDEVWDAHVVDGGYLEGSGAGTANELWDHLEARVSAWNADRSRACIVPFFLQIDNGYENPGAPAVGRPREALVPLATLLGSQFGRIANAREQAAIEFDSALMSDGSILRIDHGGAPIESRYARLVTKAHPGVQAPLGWTLSRASIDDLRSQLSIAENQRELAEVAGWLEGDLTCHGDP
jgi:hypothetical protein